MKILKTVSAIIFVSFLFTVYQNLMAFRDGIVGLTKKNGEAVGCVCHGLKPNDSISVLITGPSTVRINDTAIYVLNIANGPAMAGGCDIATSLGNVNTSALDTSLRRAEPFTGAGFELTHKYPKLFEGDTLKFIFKYVAPSTPNVFDTIFANGNSVNNDTTSEHDNWNFAANFLVFVEKEMSVTNINSIADRSFELEQNYPNPFNPETKINFTISKPSNIILRIFDASGKSVAELINNKYYSSGNYSVTFNAQQYNLTSGVYFYKMEIGEFSEVKKMMLIK